MNTVNTILLILSIFFTFSTDLKAHDEHQSHVGGESRNLSVGKGQRVVIDVLSFCKEVYAKCTTEQLRIKKQPVEGVLFEMRDDGMWAYQHAGTSVNSDVFEVLVIHPDKSEASFYITVEIGAVRAKVVILEPSAGSSSTGGTIVVNYTTVGTGFDHVHLQINDENQVSLYAREGQYEFTGVEPGRYVVSAELSSVDHRVIPDSVSSVEVFVVD